MCQKGNVAIVGKDPIPVSSALRGMQSVTSRVMSNGVMYHPKISKAVPSYCDMHEIILGQPAHSSECHILGQVHTPPSVSEYPSTP